MEPRYNEGPRDWQNTCMFPIMRFRYIKVLFHTFFYYWGQKIVQCAEDFIVNRFVILIFCSTLQVKTTTTFLASFSHSNLSGNTCFLQRIQKVTSIGCTCNQFISICVAYFRFLAIACSLLEMYSAIIFLLSDQSIWLGTPWLQLSSCKFHGSKASFPGYFVGRRKRSHSGKPGKRGLCQQETH